jgi:hypothetical protein
MMMRIVVPELPKKRDLPPADVIEKNLDKALDGQVAELAPQDPKAHPASAPEGRTQTALRLTLRDQARVAMLAAQKTAETGGSSTFSKQDIMETAVREYLDREEKKRKK